MLRKVERSHAPKQPVNHPIDLTPPVGIPPLERPDKTKTGAESKKHSGDPAIRRNGDRLSRRLRALEVCSNKSKRGEPVELELTASEAESSATVESSTDTVIQSGDPIARKARQLKRKSKR
jgi:hypothetical protein